MKKLAILLLLLVATTFTLVACNQADPTTTSPRWEDETHVFDITLADFAPEEDSKIFNTYANGDSTYAKDALVIVGNVAENFSSVATIKPYAIKGTYTLTIDVADDGQTCTVTGVQNFQAQYLTSQVENSLDALASVVVPQGEGNVFATHTDEQGNALTTLKNSSTTSVAFENTPAQRPIASSTKVDGFNVVNIAGKTCATKFEVAVRYDLDENRAYVTKDGGEEQKVKIKAKSGNVIDSNQILMYTRSLDKSSKGFNDAPSAIVFNGQTGKTYTANFGLTREAKIALTGNDSSNVYATVNVVGVVVGGQPFMQQVNLPSSLAEKNLDLAPSTDATNAPSKFTTVRFRTGFVAYELATYDQAILDALVPAPAAQ